MALSIRLVLVAVLAVTVTKTVWGASSNWWSLGVSNCATPGADCDNCAKLENNSTINKAQGSMCSDDPSTVHAVARGTRQAIIDCQARFSDRKWNCSTFFGENLFGNFVVESRTRETATIFAYLTAGAVQEVSEACHDQRLINCPCIGLGRIDDGDNVVFKSCDANLPWALKYVTDFIGVYNSSDVGVESDLHNIEVGKQAINYTTESCVCHGVSGTCSVKTCYQKVPVVSEIGESLSLKYDGAVKVELVDGKLQRKGNPSADPLRKTDLAYVSDSPDLCEANTAKSIIGTAHRVCENTPSSRNSCSVLCCGRGAYTVTKITPVEECRFVWCCEIQCSVVGNKTETVYRCNE